MQSRKNRINDFLECILTPGAAGVAGASIVTGAILGTFLAGAVYFGAATAPMAAAYGGYLIGTAVVTGLYHCVDSFLLFSELCVVNDRMKALKAAAEKAAEEKKGRY